MESHDLASWGEFRPLIDDLRARYGARDQLGLMVPNRLLFRGLADSGWPLSTTLERFSAEEFTVERYMMHASGCRYEIESFTGKSWGVADYTEMKREIAERQSEFRPYLPSYDYLVYLRHHGFPSPLLDWTASPYVAAYFAYAQSTGAERIAVYFYVETPEGGKSWTGTPPMIHAHGPYVTTDSRHFTQKASYTVCTQWDEEHSRHAFRAHSLVFDQGNPSQDVLVKITIPATDRLVALRELRDYNIDDFTLFQTEDSLVKALALKEFELD